MLASFQQHTEEENHACTRDSSGRKTAITALSKPVSISVIPCAYPAAIGCWGPDQIRPRSTGPVLGTASRSSPAKAQFQQSSIPLTTSVMLSTP